MTVRAKFKVISVNANLEGLKTVALAPVTSGSAENEEFFKWTPAGSISMGTISAEAAKQFELDKEFYVDFTAAD